jgi:hypothetical protein
MRFPEQPALPAALQDISKTQFLVTKTKHIVYMASVARLKQ